MDKSKSVFIVANKKQLLNVFDSFSSYSLAFNFANNHYSDAGLSSILSAQQWMSVNDFKYLTSREVLAFSDSNTNIVIHSYDHNDWRNSSALFRCVDNSFNIVLLHWGEEYVHSPHPDQRKVAYQLIAKGADLIVGNHPHVLQGYENIGTSAVYYSIGNTVFGFKGMPEEAKLGSFLEINTESKQTKLIPVVISGTGVHELRTAYARNTFTKLSELLNNSIDISENAWYIEAAIPFFNNHMNSWKQRIRRYGIKHFFLFLRACLTRSYLKMLIGFLMSLGKKRVGTIASTLIRDILKSENTESN